MTAADRRGRLYCIPTPIGEASPAPRVLPADTIEVTTRLDYFIAESAKAARAFLRQLPIGHALQSIEIVEHNEHTRGRDVAALLAPLLSGRDGGLLSDAGCPGVADPGADVVAAAHRAGIRVVPMVGPSSLLLALMASGLNGQQFAFAGYLPVDRGAREQRARELELRSARSRETVLVIETPYRNQAMLETLATVLAPATELMVAIDVGQPGEAIRTRRAAEWREHMVALPKAPAVFAFLAAAAPAAARRAAATSTAAPAGTYRGRPGGARRR